jgi:succinate dehydrogenase / fumarate reductase iron-sulfur subunit
VNERHEFTLHIWRQPRAPPPARWSPTRSGISEHMSFLEMLDVLNEQLHREGRGAGRVRQRLPRGHLRHVRLVINGGRTAPTRHHDLPAAHAAVQDGDEIYVEPWRAGAFPVVKDLCVDRKAFDASSRPAASSRNTGSAPDANAVPVPKERRRPRVRRRRLHRLRRLRRRVPQRLGDAVHRRQGRALREPAAGPAERLRRVKAMVTAMDAEGFGNCTNHYECEAACPKGISR